MGINRSYEPCDAKTRYIETRVVCSYRRNVGAKHPSNDGRHYSLTQVSGKIHESGRRDLGERMSAALLTQLREYSTPIHIRDGRDAAFKSVLKF